MEAITDFRRENHVADGEAQYLLLEQTRHLRRNAGLGILATALNATILAFVLRSTIPLSNLLIWLAAVYLTVGLRYFQLYRCRLDSMTPAETGDWGRQFIILTALSGILWGTAGIFLFSPDSIAHQAFLAFVLGGMAAGAVAAYAASRPAFLVFTLPALLPYTVRLFTIGDEIHIAMGAMALLFTGLIVIMGAKLHETTVSTLKLRFENKNYMEYLALAKERAEQLNNELTTEINERRRGEEELRKHREHLQELVDEQTIALSSANEQIHNAQKLESLGIIAGGIAHDFNNLLSGMFGYIDLARGEAEKSGIANIARYLAKALGAFDRAKHLTQQLLTFSKGGAPILKTQPIAEHVQKTILFALSGSNVAPAFIIPEDIPLCSFDENQLAQVFDNIAINACQAMPRGGKLEVCISNVTAESAPPVLPPKAYVRISICDEGSGIISDHLPHIFDPFFTTKKEGSGLGLATSYSIIKKHGGHIEVAATSDRGTTFHVYLPAAITDNPAAERATPALHKGRGRILLLDDEEFMLDLLSIWLQEMGYEVATAKEGSQAVALAREAAGTGQPFLAAILDLTIPGGRGGKDVVRELLDVDPSLKVVASSGYSEDPVMSNPRAYGFEAGLIKPYRKEHLASVLTSLLAQTHGF